MGLLRPINVRTIYRQKNEILYKKEFNTQVSICISLKKRQLYDFFGYFFLLCRAPWSTIFISLVIALSFCKFIFYLFRRNHRGLNSFSRVLLLAPIQNSLPKPILNRKCVSLKLQLDFLVSSIKKANVRREQHTRLSALIFENGVPPHLILAIICHV